MISSMILVLVKINQTNVCLFQILLILVHIIKKIYIVFLIKMKQYAFKNVCLDDVDEEDWDGPAVSEPVVSKPFNIEPVTFESKESDWNNNMDKKMGKMENKSEYLFGNFDEDLSDVEGKFFSAGEITVSK